MSADHFGPPGHPDRIVYHKEMDDALDDFAAGLLEAVDDRIARAVRTLREELEATGTLARDPRTIRFAGNEAPDGAPVFVPWFEEVRDFLSEAERATVRPGDPRMNVVVGGPGGAVPEVRVPADLEELRHVIVLFLNRPETAGADVDAAERAYLATYGPDESWGSETEVYRRRLGRHVREVAELDDPNPPRGGRDPDDVVGEDGSLPPGAWTRPHPERRVTPSTTHAGMYFVKCDCGPADSCPMGRKGSGVQCVIWRRDRRAAR